MQLMYESEMEEKRIRINSLMGRNPATISKLIPIINWPIINQWSLIAVCFSTKKRFKSNRQRYSIKLFKTGTRKAGTKATIWHSL